MKRHIFLIYLHYTKLVDVMGVEPISFITYLQTYTKLISYNPTTFGRAPC